MRKAIGVVLAVLLSVVFFSPVVFSTAEFNKKEGKTCTYCHTKAGSKDLNDVGKCYKENKNSLEKCKDKGSK